MDEERVEDGEGSSKKIYRGLYDAITIISAEEAFCFREAWGMDHIHFSLGNPCFMELCREFRRREKIPYVFAEEAIYEALLHFSDIHSPRDMWSILETRVDKSLSQTEQK